MELSVADHPLLDLQAFVVELAQPLGETSTPETTMNLLSLTADSPFDMLGDEVKREKIKAEIRDVFRGSGYKPTGRGKPASEYLIKAVGDDRLSSINPIVDVCNIVSLHSGIPISVVDLDLCKPPLKVEIAPKGSEYVFNATGQTIKLDGLLCLFDSNGPCANAVKDSQRTKTNDQTKNVFVLIWGSIKLEDRSVKAADWYQGLIEEFGSIRLATL